MFFLAPYLVPTPGEATQGQLSRHSRSVASKAMSRPRHARTAAPSNAPDLFSIDTTQAIAHRLDALVWPDQERFPVNRASARVRLVVWQDLATSEYPMIVAGYSSIDQLVDFVAYWCHRAAHGQVRVLLGAEPYPSTRRDFSSRTAGFTEEAKQYWLDEHGISLRLSAKVVRAIEALESGQLVARFLHGSNRLHAKIYLGDQAATVGSSNFTQSGLSDQVEVNARFDRTSDPGRYDELAQVASNLWSAGTDWAQELRDLLSTLLKVVTWQEALARACAELLDGEWAERYLAASPRASGGAALWPSQRAGIAQALWVTKELGSVLVADATGSGKTRMGAHLVRAVQDRLWSSGQARRDLSVVVCPPAVENTWKREAVACGLNLQTASHGVLSQPGQGEPRVEEEAVARAQILAVDEAHNFLNRKSRRTVQLRASRADYILMFTATPINRGARDLLSLVSLLGADNFEDRTLQILEGLGRPRRAADTTLAQPDVEALRGEIARFTVRRTKAALNELVEREPGSYVQPDTGRICRYPRHNSRTYPTKEPQADEIVAQDIRASASSLSGVARLERVISVPPALRNEYNDERWLESRLVSTKGLAAHSVLAALRSSRAALLEHLLGTTAAAAELGLEGRFKPSDTGNVIGRLEDLARQGPPKTELGCPLPDWLANQAAWAEACRAEAGRYQQILASARQLSPAREEAKAALLAGLARSHDRVLAFDYHLITLSVLEAGLRGVGVESVVATGSSVSNRHRVERLFARGASGRAVALCSDALSEGLNLQGASAIVHLDLPTTLRVAEQRVGRVDRMDSPHDAIEVWWPADGPSFATRANELLLRRSAENASLLGSNLKVPDLSGTRDDEHIVNVEEQIKEAEAGEREPWDGILDALEPVRQLVSGPNPLITPQLYKQLRQEGAHRVLARVSPLRTARPWAFLAVAGSADGAPRWLFLDGPSMESTSSLEHTCARLRDELAQGPPNHILDDDALALLDKALDAASRSEFNYLPRRMRRALEQMGAVLPAWVVKAQGKGDELAGQRLREIARLAQIAGPDNPVDPYLVAGRWLTLVSPVMDAFQRQHRHRPFVLLSDITSWLIADPLPTDDVLQAFSDLPDLVPLADRVTACILGVPAPVGPRIPGVPTTI